MNITVTGSATESVVADEASLNIVVESDGHDQQQVVVRATDLVNAVTAECVRWKDSGIVARFSVDGLRTWSQHPAPAAVIKSRPRHHARANAQVVFTDFDALGELVAEVASRDGWSVSDLSWQLSEQARNQIEPVVLTAAFSQAKTRAQWLATAAEAGELDVTDVTVHDSGVGVRALAASFDAVRSAGAEFPAIDLTPGTVDVSGHVQVVFRTQTEATVSYSSSGR